MKRIELASTFIELLGDMFRKIGYRVRDEVEIGESGRRRVDLEIIKEDTTIWIEGKFYRDDHVSGAALSNAVLQLNDHLRFAKFNTSGLVITSSYVPNTLKEEVKDSYGIFIWDRSDIYNIVKYKIKDEILLESFAKLILSVRQGLDIRGVFDEVAKSKDSTLLYNIRSKNLGYVQRDFPGPSKKGEVLTKELNAIPAGRPGWRHYELKCVEILKYLFDGELSKWDEQNTTDDELSRFDMICRVLGNGDFWSSLIQSFQSRYVLFEFKNYSDPIGQDQIYTTERYLYLRGLRSVGFIISRAGGKQQAWKAAKGALREHGKLIIILDNGDLIKMLEMKDMGDMPRDLLSEKLDDFLISLSR